MDIWKDAPESATHYDIEASCFCKNDGYWVTGDRARYVQDNDQVRWGDKDRYTPKPQPTLTYTQEMADNGEFPSVGMECLAKSSRGTTIADWSKGEIKYKSPQLTVFEIDGCIEVCCNSLLGNELAFKPLTPPIELIDGKAYQFQHQSCRGLGFYNERLDEFSSLNHKIDIRNCTNIQPLTAEVK